MSAHHYGLGTRYRAGEPGNNIAGVAADLFAGIIDFDLCTHLFPILLDAQGHIAFFARMAVNLDKLEQKILDSLLVDHQLLPVINWRLKALGYNILSSKAVRCRLHPRSRYSPRQRSPRSTNWSSARCSSSRFSFNSASLASFAT